MKRSSCVVSSLILAFSLGPLTATAQQANRLDVVADVVEHKRGPKLIAFKMKRRKGYLRKVGHRQDLTVVKITDIQTGGKPAKPKAAKKAAQKEEAEAPAEKQAENKE